MEWLYFACKKDVHFWKSGVPCYKLTLLQNSNVDVLTPDSIRSEAFEWGLGPEGETLERD